MNRWKKRKSSMARPDGLIWRVVRAAAAGVLGSGYAHDKPSRVQGAHEGRASLHFTRRRLQLKQPSRDLKWPRLLCDLPGVLDFGGGGGGGASSSLPLAFAGGSSRSLATFSVSAVAPEEGDFDNARRGDPDEDIDDDDDDDDKYGGGDGWLAAQVMTME